MSVKKGGYEDRTDDDGNGIGVTEEVTELPVAMIGKDNTCRNEGEETGTVPTMVNEGTTTAMRVSNKRKVTEADLSTTQSIASCSKPNK